MRKLPPAGDLARPYRRRAAIAAVCRDRTTSGWHWEASQVRDVAHQSALVLALALATLLTRCLGEEAARTILNPPPRAGRRRPRHARDRLFRVGRDRLWQRLWQDEPPAITWELVHVDAPNWSTACWQSARPAATPVHRTGRVGKRARLRVAAEGNSMHVTRLFCPPLNSHTGRRGSLGVLKPKAREEMQGLAKKPAAGSGDALGARASGAHPAGCLQPEKERQKRGRPAMTTTPLRRPFAPHPPNPLLPQGEKGASGHLEAQNERRNARASRKPAPVSACEGIAGGL